MPAEHAKKLLGDTAWDAALSIQPWEVWCRKVDHGRAFDAFDAYRQAVKAKNGHILLPDGVPRTALGMVLHATGYLQSYAKVVGINGQGLASLNLSAGAYLYALDETVRAFQNHKVEAGKPMAAYLLGVAIRVAKEGQKA